MSNSVYYFIESVDTWSFRGNRGFGDAGSYGETVFPPMPSVVAGAFRSRLLSESPSHIEGFIQGDGFSDSALQRILGTPDEPGSFRLSSLSPARRDSQGSVEVLVPLPADVMVSENGKTISFLYPQERPDSLMSSAPEMLPYLPVLRRGKATKPESGWLLTSSGLDAYIKGEPLQSREEDPHIIHSSRLWSDETRVGIGMHAQSRSAEDGKLFSIQNTALCHSDEGHGVGYEAGLLVGLQGCENRLQEHGMLRLGGDGRAGVFKSVEKSTGLMHALPEQINNENRFKLILQTPGLFTRGWFPDGIHEKNRNLVLDWQGVRARLVCAAIPGHTVVSGWDLARWCPKPAQRAVLSGSVYWFELLHGDPGQLGKLAEQGLWALERENIDRQREAEGYNRVYLALW